MLLDRGLCVEPDCSLFMVESGTGSNQTSTSSTEAKTDKADDPAETVGHPDEAKPFCSGDDDNRADDATADEAMTEEQKDGEDHN